MTRIAAPKGVSALEETFATHLRWQSVTGWEREVRFHPERRWRFDFAWAADKVAVEIEGGTWIAGGHSRGAAFEADCIKYAEAAILGWMVLRVTNHMVEDGRAIMYLVRALSVVRSARRAQVALLSVSRA